MNGRDSAGWSAPFASQGPPPPPPDVGVPARVVQQQSWQGRALAGDGGPPPPPPDVGMRATVLQPPG